MHKSTIAAVLSTAAGLAAATPATLRERSAECLSSHGAYYVCGSNGFRGTCKSDPCALPWCPDYKEWSCELSYSGWTPPPPPPPPVMMPICYGEGSWYRCESNGFHGNCKSDPCDAAWCPDYEPKTCTPAPWTPPPPPPPPPPAHNPCYGEGGWYVCANNGFHGNCKSDPCNIDWCPDYEPKTCTPKPWTPQPWTPPPPPPPASHNPCYGEGSWYVCAKNGFQGNCKSDPCNADWCPDYEPWTCTPKPWTWSPPPPPPPPPTHNTCYGEGQWYACANNGFHGNCKSDPCYSDWCPDYEPWTCTPKPWTPPPPPPPPTHNTCYGEGSWYVCAKNGFHGNCKSDPCNLDWCPDYEPWTCTPKPWTPPPPPPPPTHNTCYGEGSWYVCAKNGFHGNCKSDPCNLDWCPDYEPWTCTPKPWTPPPPPPPPTHNTCYGEGSWYVCAKNGFHGNCKSDPCNLDWCPDYEPWTCTPKPWTPQPWTPPPAHTTCYGEGPWYVCAANGFQGNCKSDPCSSDWCPDYEPKTCTPKPHSPPPPHTGGGAYYVCAKNSFQGRCSVDPCALDWCPDYLRGMYVPKPTFKRMVKREVLPKPEAE